MSLSDLHLHKMKSDNYPFFTSVLKLLENPRRLLITVVTSNEAVNISISILAASLFIGLFGAPGQWVSIVVTSLVLFFAGEAIPKTFGVTYPMQIASAVSPLLLLISRLEFPSVAALEKTPGFILRRLGRRRARRQDVLMEDEFKHLIDAGSRDGVVDESQRELIKTIFASGDRPVTDIMIPRVEMFCLPADRPPAENLSAVISGRYERCRCTGRPRRRDRHPVRPRSAHGRAAPGRARLHRKGPGPPLFRSGDEIHERPPGRFSEPVGANGHRRR